MSEQALRDARLISRYASARGLLPADSPLPNAINQAEARLAAGPLTAAQEQELNSALNVEARRISPVTIERLRAEGLRATRPLVLQWLSWVWYAIGAILIPTAVGVICAVLIFVIVPLTTNFNRIGVFVSELKPADIYEFFGTMTDARLLQLKLSAARDPAPVIERKTVVAEQPKQKQPKQKKGPATRSTPPAPVVPVKAVDQAEIDKLEADLKPKIKYLQEANSRITVNLESINRVIDSTTGAPRWYALIIESYGLDDVSRFVLYRLFRLKEPTRLIATSANDDVSVIERAIAYATVRCGVWDKEERDELANPGSVPNPRRPGAYWKALCENTHYAEGIGLKVIAPGVVLEASVARQHAESLNILLGSAILPVLYGLLGASVFLLRRAWGEDTNVARARPLTIGSFLRLALGGIAGLAIGWFWVPTAKTAGDLTALTTTPFALAFLAGFSIELLFALLDRILGAINPSTQQQQEAAAAPSPPPPPPPGQQQQQAGQHDPAQQQAAAAPPPPGQQQQQQQPDQHDPAQQQAAAAPPPPDQEQQQPDQHAPAQQQPPAIQDGEQQPLQQHQPPEEQEPLAAAGMPPRPVR